MIPSTPIFFLQFLYYLYNFPGNVFKFACCGVCCMHVFFLFCFAWTDDSPSSSSSSSSHHHHHHHQRASQQTHYPLSSVPSTASRQLVPGVILMSDIQRAQQANNNSTTAQQATTASATQQQQADVKFSPQTTAAIAKELLDTGKVIIYFSSSMGTWLPSPVLLLLLQDVNALSKMVPSWYRWVWSY